MGWVYHSFCFLFSHFLLLWSWPKGRSRSRNCTVKQQHRQLQSEKLVFLDRKAEKGIFGDQRMCKRPYFLFLFSQTALIQRTSPVTEMYCRAVEQVTKILKETPFFWPKENEERILVGCRHLGKSKTGKSWKKEKGFLNCIWEPTQHMTWACS